MTQDPFVPGQFYHVYNRANGGDLVFLQERNYHYFLKKFGTYMVDAFEVMAYCLLPNHFHFLVRTKEEGLVYHSWSKESRRKNRTFDYSTFISGRQKAWLSGYAQAINKQEGRKGSLFMHNTKRKIIWDNRYLINVVHYIHLNPIHHGYVKNFEDWPFSSYHHVVKNDNPIPPWLENAVLLNWFEGRHDFELSHHLSKVLSLDRQLER